jgi:hypothetical protein
MTQNVPLINFHISLNAFFYMPKYMKSRAIYMKKYITHTHTHLWPQITVRTEPKGDEKGYVLCIQTQLIDTNTTNCVCDYHNGDDAPQSLGYYAKMQRCQGRVNIVTLGTYFDMFCNYY